MSPGKLACSLAPLNSVSVYDFRHTVDEAKKLKDHLPNANIVILDECAHFPMLEKPDETVDLILNFLNKQQQ